MENISILFIYKNRVDGSARIREIVADAGSSFRIYGGSRGHG